MEQQHCQIYPTGLPDIDLALFLLCQTSNHKVDVNWLGKPVNYV